jgi:hypothetical protein
VSVSAADLARRCGNPHRRRHLRSEQDDQQDDDDEEGAQSDVHGALLPGAVRLSSIRCVVPRSSRATRAILSVRSPARRANTPTGGVAQLVRAPACHAGGRGFESRRSRLESRCDAAAFFVLRSPRSGGRDRRHPSAWACADGVRFRRPCAGTRRLAPDPPEWARFRSDGGERAGGRRPWPDGGQVAGRVEHGRRSCLIESLQRGSQSSPCWCSGAVETRTGAAASSRRQRQRRAWGAAARRARGRPRCAGRIVGSWSAMARRGSPSSRGGSTRRNSGPAVGDADRSARTPPLRLRHQVHHRGRPDAPGGAAAHRSRPAPRTGGPRSVPGGVFVPGPGCYELAYRAAGVDERIVFAAAF